MKKLGESLSTLEVAHDLGLGRATIHRWIQDDTIPAIKVGWNYQIPLEPYLNFKASYVQSEDASDTPQLHRLIEEWLHHLRNGPRPLSPKTVDDYGYNFRIFLRTIGGAGHVDADQPKQGPAGSVFDLLADL
ncbi:excisionase family DNA-binding protein [bacterium]|nr:excisionase family DNA-binding protein [bacterium]